MTVKNTFSSSSSSSQFAVSPSLETEFDDSLLLLSCVRTETQINFPITWPITPEILPENFLKRGVGFSEYSDFFT